jgi:thymidylate synthase ThyX
MSFNARIICDSISSVGVRLTTFEVTLPRIVLAELNTHRAFSRNSASSRAIPVEKRIAMIEADPFIPEQFGRNQKGMQALDVLSDDETQAARNVWQHALTDAIQHARALSQLGVHKQLANRLIEPFCWQTVLISATEWDNFFHLRCNSAAQPEIRRAAELMQAIMAKSEPALVHTGGWHMPFVTDEEREIYKDEYLVKVAVGRCARVSYLTHDGKRELDKDVALHDQLLRDGHMSPLEHVAQPWNKTVFCGNLRGWQSYRKTIPHEEDVLGQEVFPRSAV